MRDVTPGRSHQQKVTRKIIWATILIIIAAISFVACNTQEDKKEIQALDWQAGTYVYDQADILDQSTKANINQKLQKLEADTSDQVIIATVTDLGDYSLEDYSNELFRKTGIGQKDKDNGLLVLLAKDEDKIRIEVGYGLEGQLNDGKIGRILDESYVPYKSNKNQALTKLTDSLLANLDPDKIQDSSEEISSSSQSEEKDDEGNLFIDILKLLFLIIIIVIISKYGGPGAGMMLFGGNSGGWSGGSSGSSGGFGGGSSGGGGASR